MSEEFKKAFDNLSVSDKRNEISNELLIIGELIKNIENKYGVDSLIKIKNYDINKDKELNETQMLSFIYEDIYNVRREIVTILAAINIKSN